MRTKLDTYEEDRRGGILLKTSEETTGNPGETGTGAIIYHRGEKIKEIKNYIGNHITKCAAEYISIILGLKEIRNTFRCLRNKVLIIHIKSQLTVNQIRNIWKIKNPKLYFLYTIVMSLL